MYHLLWGKSAAYKRLIITEPSGDYKKIKENKIKNRHPTVSKDKKHLSSNN
jgi:hypothetical protein